MTEVTETSHQWECLSRSRGTYVGPTGSTFDLREAREGTKAEERKSSALGVVGLSAGEPSLSLARLKPYPLLIYQINQHSYLCTCEEIQPRPVPSKSPWQSGKSISSKKLEIKKSRKNICLTKIFLPIESFFTKIREKIGDERICWRK